MNEPNAPKPTEHPDNDKPEAMEYADRVAHLKAGYDNSQSVVRFLDTKASAVIAVIPVIIVALTALFGVVKDWARWERAFTSEHACTLWIMLTVTAIVAVALLVTAISAIVSAFRAITPRDTGTVKPSILFPFAKAYEYPPPDDSFASRVAFFKDSAKRPDVLEDYERQLVRMSQIVSQKLIYVNDAVKYLKRFFVAAACLLGLVVASTFLSAALASSNIDKSKPPLVPTTNSALTSRSS